MKRSGPLKRGKPLERRTPLKRGAPLKRGGPLKRRRRDPRTDLEKELAANWHLDLGYACACGCGRAASYENPIQGHHVVRVQLLKAHVRGLRWSRDEVAELLWDRRNRLPLLEDCHARHHRRLPALKWTLIEEKAPEAIVFAEQVGLLWRAKLDYDLEG